MLGHRRARDGRHAAREAEQRVGPLELAGRDGLRMRPMSAGMKTADAVA